MEKRCPLTLGAVVSHRDHQADFYACIGQSCAWWFESEETQACSVTVFARVFAYAVSDMVFKLRQVTGAIVRMKSNEDS